MIFYHGTAALNLARIKREGLIPKAAPGGDEWAKKYTDWGTLPVLYSPKRCRSVFVSGHVDVAAWFADMAALLNKDKPAVLKLELPKPFYSRLVPDQAGNEDDLTWALQFEGTIPPDMIADVFIGKDLKFVPRPPVDLKMGVHLSGKVI